MTSLLKKIDTNPNDLASWSSLLNFGKNILRKPVRTGKRHNLASVIKKRTDADHSQTEDVDQPQQRHRKRDAAAVLAAAVTAKIEDGNIKAAIRILCSEEKPATDTEATFKKLEERHPAPPADRSPAPDPRNTPAIQVTEDDVMKAIRAEMPGIQKQLPAGMKLGIPYDATVYIKDALKEVMTTLLETLAIVVVVIFLFLGSFRSVLIPVVAIPLSLIGAVFLMQVFGFTINLLTLLAIVLSVGLVVDDAIVVVENVERHLSQGESPLDAALLGARELIGPIIAMTIPLAAVYAPIGLQGGLTGSLFREFAFTLAGAVTISGVVALTLSPMMSAKLLREGHEPTGLAALPTRAFEWLKATYARHLDVALGMRPIIYTAWAVVITSTVMALVAVARPSLTTSRIE